MRERDWIWRVCLLVCCGLLVAPLWIARVPPLVDLPQHAAQIAIAKSWHNPAAGYQSVYEINYLNNTIVSYALVYLLALIAPILVAFKVALSAALLATVFMTARLIRAVDGNRWAIFAIFPALYGYAFMWGFVNFVVAVPLGLLMLDAALRFRATPTRRLAITLALWTSATFLTHILVVAYAGLAALFIVWFGSQSRRDRWIGAGALATVVPVAGAWWTATMLLSKSTTPSDAPLVLGYGIERVPGLLSAMLGQTLSPLTVVVGLATLALPWLLGGRPSRVAWRWMPLGVVLACHFLLPLNLGQTAYVAPRFAVFLVPALLIACDRGASERRVVRIPIVLVAAGWLIGITLQFRAFDIESQTPLDLIAKAGPHGRLLALIDSPTSTAVDNKPYLHIGQMYQVERTGIADFSFAEFFPNRFRYRPEADPPLPLNIEWEPVRFRWSEHGGALYDYFLVRAVDPRVYFKGARYSIRVVANGPNGWWLLHQTKPAP